MRKNENKERIEGYVYQHSLEVKTVGNKDSANYGKEYISGNIEVAVDNDLLNVIPVNFNYVTEVFGSGKVNATFGVLKKLIEENKTVVAVGKELATKVRIDTALGLNEFYNQQDQLISTKINDSGFVTIINELGEEGTRNTFRCDMVITNVVHVEADEEKGIEKDYVTIKGAAFNFRNELLPVEFKVTNIQGMNYFEDLEASAANPVYTKVWGNIICNTIKNVVEEETAFGEAAVRTYERKIKDWIVTGCQKEIYDFGEEGILTVEELKKATQDREVKLAEIKKKALEYRASKAAAPAQTQTTTATPTAAAPAGGFTF